MRSRADTALTVWRSRLDERGRHVAASIYFDEAVADADVATEAAVPEPAAAASRRELTIACTSAWSGGGRTRPPGRGAAAWTVVRLAAGWSNAGARSPMPVRSRDLSGAVCGPN